MVISVPRRAATLTPSGTPRPGWARVIGEAGCRLSISMCFLTLKAGQTLENGHWVQQAAKGEGDCGKSQELILYSRMECERAWHIDRIMARNVHCGKSTGLVMDNDLSREYLSY